MSKLLILSAGVSEDSNNTKLAKKLNKFLDEKAVPNEIHENLYENIPFLLNNQKDVPKNIGNEKISRKCRQDYYF